MQIRVGIKTGDLIQLNHSQVSVIDDTQVRKTYVARNSRVVLKDAAGVKELGKTFTIKSGRQPLVMESAKTAASPARGKQSYRGALEISATGNNLRVVLITDLEQYVQGVLQSEVPAYFKLEAMKAQAVLARTYGLRPRLPHKPDGFDVCDSYLHCQAFYGVRALTGMQQKAITDTNGQLLLYRGEPALALFSACAGGHTEDYQNCFSDPESGAFPPAPIPYLTAVAEGRLPAGFPDEAAMRALYADPAPDTVDAWSMSHFRWQVNLTADMIEAHMHHIVDKLRSEAQFAPFIKPCASGKFGHVKGFEVERRGAAGTVMFLRVKTSEGDWIFGKELTIRSLFENPEIKLKRLRSARLFFDHGYDSIGLLSRLTVRGFGSGHGVGLQQIGAQGLANRGKNYLQIIAHYYPGTTVGS